jgi:hypothetical protein
MTQHIYLNTMDGKDVTIIDPTTSIQKKKGDELLCSYKDCKSGSIPNILVKLFTQKSDGINFLF